MSKYIIREVAPEACEFSFYFDDDGLTERGGDYCMNLFILNRDGWRNYSGFNIDEYKRVQAHAQEIIDGFCDLRGEGWTAPIYDSFKDCMTVNGIKYNSRKCHLLKEWAIDADVDDTETIADFLTITTGKKWTTSSASGYCQGDYVEMVYCPEFYRDGVQAYGEIYLGCGKEFSVTDYDDDGNELDTVYGFIVADCQAWRDEDYKRLVCEWYGCKEEETTLEMIDDCNMTYSYSYREAC